MPGCLSGAGLAPVRQVIGADVRQISCILQICSFPHGPRPPSSARLVRVHSWQPGCIVAIEQRMLCDTYWYAENPWGSSRRSLWRDKTGVLWVILEIWQLAGGDAAWLEEFRCTSLPPRRQCWWYCERTPCCSLCLRWSTSDDCQLVMVWMSKQVSAGIQRREDEGYRGC